MPSTWRLMIEGLFATITNVNFNEASLKSLVDRVHSERDALAQGCASCGEPCGRTGDYDLRKLWNADEDIRSLKSLVLFGIRGVAAYAYHAMVLGYTSDELDRFFLRALRSLGERLGLGQFAGAALMLGGVLWISTRER